MGGGSWIKAEILGSSLLCREIGLQKSWLVKGASENPILDMDHSSGAAS